MTATSWTHSRSTSTARSPRRTTGSRAPASSSPRRRSAAAFGAGAGRAHAAGLPASDQDVLNYALVLEYLQAAFYTEAERAKGLTRRPRRAAEVVGAVERAHVKAFRDLLGKRRSAGRTSTSRA